MNLYLWSFIKIMSNKCVITGKKTKFGNNVSHANNKTRRKFKANLSYHRIVLDSGLVIRRKISTKALRLMNKCGVDAVCKKYNLI